MWWFNRQRRIICSLTHKRTHRLNITTKSGKISVGVFTQWPCLLCVCVFQSGLIRLSQEEYLIAPLPQHLAERHNYSAPDGHHPHVVYKRSAEHVVHRRSSSSSSTSSSRAVNPYLHHHHYHHHHLQDHHHHDYQHGKLQRQHFCGRRKQCM